MVRWPTPSSISTASEIVAHKDGYTPFEVRLTGNCSAGDNLLTVKIDGSENPEIPPFGGRIDYLTYAGIYRDVWLKGHRSGLDRQRQDRDAGRAGDEEVASASASS